MKPHIEKAVVNESAEHTEDCSWILRKIAFYFIKLKCCIHAKFERNCVMFTLHIDVQAVFIPV